MIESLTIGNFQKHKKLRIDFDEHITSIVGRSDIGKSSIIRALRWVCTNHPSGDAFVRRGSGGICKVSVKVDNRLVKRQKGKGVNCYSLDRQSYHALGQGGIPEDIAKLLNVSSINFQNQHDAPFWFSLTAGEVSKQINQIVNLQLIDKVLSHVASQLRGAKATRQVSEGRLAESLARAKELSWAKEAKASLDQLEILYASIQERKQKVRLLRNLISDVQLLKGERDRAADASVCVGKLLKTAKALYDRQERIDGMQSLIDEISRCESDLESTRKQHKDTLTRLEKEMDGKCPLCQQNIKEVRRALSH